MGIATAGLSEAIRPALNGGNRDLMDNIGAAGTTGIGPMLGYQQMNRQQPQQAAPDYNRYFQQTKQAGMPGTLPRIIS